MRRAVALAVRQRFHEHPNGAGAAPHVFVVVGGGPGRHLRQPLVGPQWTSVYRHWAAWCDRGVWLRLMAYLQTEPDLSAVRLDSTVVSAAGVPKNKGTDPALSRSRGGFGTQIHILADRHGRPL